MANANKATPEEQRERCYIELIRNLRESQRLANAFIEAHDNSKRDRNNDDWHNQRDEVETTARLIDWALSSLECMTSQVLEQVG